MSFRKTDKEVLRIIVRGGAVIDVIETLGVDGNNFFKIREKETGGIAEVKNDEFTIFIFKEGTENTAIQQKSTASIFGK